MGSSGSGTSSSATGRSGRVMADLLTVRGEGAGTRTLYAQEEIHATGFAAAADARAAVPSSLRTVAAIVRQGTWFHV